MPTAALSKPQTRLGVGRQDWPSRHRTLPGIDIASAARSKAAIANQHGDDELEQFYDDLHVALQKQAERSDAEARRSATEFTYGALLMGGI